MKAASRQDGVLDPLPPQLVSPRAKLVDLYLASVGEGTVDELQIARHESLLSLFKVLGAHLNLGLLGRRGGSYVATGQCTVEGDFDAETIENHEVNAGEIERAFPRSTEVEVVRPADRPVHVVQPDRTEK